MTSAIEMRPCLVFPNAIYTGGVERAVWEGLRHLDSDLAAWDGASEQIPCSGHAILFARSLAAVLPDDLPPELALADSLARQHATRELAHGGFVDVDARAVVELDVDHLVRGSECSL